MGVGSLEEIIDDNHAIVSSAVGAEYYVSICSFVDKDSLEPVRLCPVAVFLGGGGEGSAVLTADMNCSPLIAGIICSSAQQSLERGGYSCGRC